MVNVDWCHDCGEPECRKPMERCEHGKKVLARRAKEEETTRMKEATRVAVRGWQDVSTAPTDTVVLVEMPNGAVYTGYKRYFSPEQKPEPFRCARTDEIIGWVSRWCAVPERSAPS